MGTARLMLIEDNPADVDLLVEALGLSDWSFQLESFPHGPAALERLRNAEPPDLILLDLNMPIMGGREVLAVLKADPALAGIPVALLTGSPWDFDILEAFGLPGDCYLVKPSTLAGFRELGERVQAIWARESGP